MKPKKMKTSQRKLPHCGTHQTATQTEAFVFNELLQIPDCQSITLQTAGSEAVTVTFRSKVPAVTH